MMTLEEIRLEVKRLDPELTENGDAFNTAVILLSALVVGAEQRRIAKFTGIPISTIRPLATRLRKAKIWVGGTTCCNWFVEPNGAMSFWMDVCVAEGLVERVEA